MPGLFGEIQVGLSGLQAQTQALSVTGENISNASTPGYHRETVALTEAPPTGSVPGGFGSGVDVVAVQRQTSNFLTLQARSAASDLGQWQTTSTILNEVQSTLNDAQGAGLGQSINTFFAGLSTLANNPQDLPTRTSVIADGQALASAFQTTSTQLTALANDTTQQLSTTVQQVNALAQQIASLNQQVLSSQSGGTSSNVLLDQRHALIDQLSTLLPVTAVDGGQTVLVGGLALVTAGTVKKVSLTNLSLQLDQTPISPTAGVLGADLTALTNTLPGIQNQLNTLASSLMTAINTQHASGYGLDGSTGLPFFTGSTASDIAVNPQLVANPAQIAAASTSGAQGDGSNAQAMANLQNQTLTGLGSSITQGYSSLIASLGQQAASANSFQQRATLLQQTVQQQEQAISGVSLDQEGANMVVQQQAYDAAALYIKTLSQVFQSLITAV